MPKANLGPFSWKARPFLGPCRCRVPCQPPRAPGLCARRGRLWGRLFSLHPTGEPEGLLSRLSTASSASPKTQLIASRRPLSTIPAANVPHFPLIQGELQRGAGAAHPSLPPPAAAGSRCSARTHRYRAPTRHLRFARENHSSACKSQAARGDRLCDQAGMAEETPPPQMPYLFAALASRVSGGGSPVLLPDPELGRHRRSRSLSLSPSIVLTLRFWVGILPGERPHPSSEQNHESFILTQEKY